MVRSLSHTLRRVIGPRALDILRGIKLEVRQWLRLELDYPIQVARAVELHGDPEYGGWLISPEGVDERSIVYDCGVGEDMTFARSLIAKYGLRVWAFDPTPRSIAWYRRQPPTPSISFLPFGVAAFDGTTRFELPDDPTHVSGTIVGGGPPDAEAILVEVHRLVTIMGDLGHARISLLKLDIEGAEYEVLEDLLRSGLQVDQILVEFHRLGRPRDWRLARAAIEQLSRHGYQLFAARHGTDFSFVRVPTPIVELAKES